MSQEAASSDSSQSARLDTLLLALREHISPSFITARIQFALEIFAHLELLSRRIRSEARQAVNLFNDQKASGLQGDEASIELGEDDAHKLLEIAIRNEERTLFGFSMATRNHHVAQALAIKNVDLGRVYVLLDTYFPSSDGLIDEEAKTSQPLFIRSMTEDQRQVCDVYRKKVMVWYEAAKRDRLAGRPGPKHEDLIPGGNKLDILAQKMLRDAEEIVKDASEMMAMFEVNEEVNTVMEEQIYDQEPDIHQEQPVLPAPAQTSKGSSRRKHFRQSLPSTVATTSKPSPSSAPAYNRRATLGSGPAVSPEIIDLSLSSPPPEPISPPSKRQKSHSRPRQSAPDFTKPVGKIGDNVPKSMKRPFSDKAMSKPRLSGGEGMDNVEAGGTGETGKRRRIEISSERGKSDAGARQVLGSKESLENSQGSGESQETKDRKRKEKGKGKADSHTPGGEKKKPDHVGAHADRDRRS